jgi:hypothetical protein
LGIDDEGVDGGPSVLVALLVDEGEVGYSLVSPVAPVTSSR